MGYLHKAYLSALLMMMTDNVMAAVDSYRFLHVTIETPWTIFLFLLVIVLFPFILMAILYWYFAAKKDQPKQSDG